MKADNGANITKSHSQINENGNALALESLILYDIYHGNSN